MIVKNVEEITRVLAGPSIQITAVMLVDCTPQG
jgi:hypothetical protein